uniref:SAP domain-containing protein n=1 Tax=Parastrongyloides trichosuri TaxID=131310 RepID=A0A0N4Z377_PARTI
MEVISTEIKDVKINGSQNLSNDSTSSSNSDYSLMTSPSIKNRQTSNQHCQITTSATTVSASPYSQYQPSSAYVNAKLATGSSEVIHVSKSISSNFSDNHQYIQNQHPKRIVTSSDSLNNTLNNSYYQYQSSGSIQSNNQSMAENDFNAYSTTETVDNLGKNNSYMPITRHYLTSQRSNHNKNINDSSQIQNNNCYQNNYKTMDKSPNYEYNYSDSNIKNVESSPLPHSSTPLSSVSYSSSTDNAPIINSNDNETSNKAKLSFMKVVELKSECKKRNISSNGSKNQLLERLQPYEDSIIASHKDINDQDNVKSTSSLNASSQHSVNQVTTPAEYYITGTSNEYMNKQYDSQNNCPSNNFPSQMNQISNGMSMLSGNVSSLNIDNTDIMSGSVVINNHLGENHINMDSMKDDIMKQESIENCMIKNQPYLLEVPPFKHTNCQSSQQVVKIVNHTGTVVGLSTLPKNISTNLATSTNNSCRYSNNISSNGINQTNNIMYYNQIPQGKANFQDNNGQSGKIAFKTITNNPIRSGNIALNASTLSRVSSSNELNTNNIEIYQQNIVPKVHNNSSDNCIVSNNIPNFSSSNNVRNSEYSPITGILPINSSTVINNPSKQSIGGIKGNENVSNKLQNGVNYVVIQKEPKQWNTISSNLDSYRVMPVHEQSNGNSFLIQSQDNIYQKNSFNNTYPVHENQKNIQKTIDHTDSTHYHMGVKHAALTSSIKNTNPNDTLKNFIFKSFPVGDINKSFKEISSEVKKIFSQNVKNPIDKSEPIMTAEIMHVHEDMIQQQFLTINKLYNELSNAQSELKNYQNILIAANNFDSQSIQRREALYPTLCCLRELDTRSINRKYMKLYSNYEVIYHNLKDGVKEHQNIIDNEEVLQDLAHVTQATEDIVRLIKQDSRTALLIVQLLRNFQVERSQCASRRNSFNVPPCEESDSKNILEQRNDQRHLETGIFKGHSNCNQGDHFLRNDNQMNEHIQHSNIIEIKNGKGNVCGNIKNSSMFSNIDKSNMNLPGPSKTQNRSRSHKGSNKNEQKSNTKATPRKKGSKLSLKVKEEEKPLNDNSRSRKTMSTGKVNDMEEIFKTVIKESSKCVSSIDSKERAEEAINDYVKNPPNSSPALNNSINSINIGSTVVTSSKSSQLSQQNSNPSQILIINKGSQYGQQQVTGNRKRANTQSNIKNNQMQQKSPKIHNCTVTRIDSLPQQIHGQHSSPLRHQLQMKQESPLIQQNIVHHQSPVQQLQNQTSTIESIDKIPQQQFHYQNFQNDQNDNSSPLNVNSNFSNTTFIQTDQTSVYNNILNSSQMSTTAYFAVPTNAITLSNQNNLGNSNNNGIIYQMGDSQQQGQYNIMTNNMNDLNSYTFTTTNSSPSTNFNNGDQNGIIQNSGTHWITNSNNNMQQTLCNNIDSHNPENIDNTNESGPQHNINTSKTGDELEMLLDDAWYNSESHNIYDNIQNNNQTINNNQISNNNITNNSNNNNDGSNVRSNIYNSSSNVTNMSQQNSNMMGYNQNFSDIDSFNYDSNDINQQGDQTMDWVDQQLMA